MTWLFVRFYVGVLIVLLLAWFIHGAVLKRRAEVETSRIFVEAHGGGARLVANEIDAAPPTQRVQVLETVRARFHYPVDVVPLSDLPASVRRQVSTGDGIAHFQVEKEHLVVASLSGAEDVVRLGPFPNYDLREIEEAIGGWMRLTAHKLESSSASERDAVMKELQESLYLPIELAAKEELPRWPRDRIDRGQDVALYQVANERWFAATPLSDTTNVVRFGPFPSFERIEQKAATTTLALVLLPAAFAIALLLRPVARQLRRVELAARQIAAGDLSARVDERRIRSAKPLAHAFNNMASRTESLVRTQRELLQAVSHELRTPLSRMRFAIGLIETAKDDEERKRRLESLDATTEDLDELVGELLSYVRMETTKPQLDLEQLTLQDTLDVLIPKHAALYSTVEFKVSESVGRGENVVLAERISFNRAIGNLLSNAGRFAKSQVVVNAEPENGFITVDVDDDGVGIPASERERVFEPFVRLDNNSSGHGAGLGLALVKRIVTLHGGRVEVFTSPLGGCRIQTKWPKSEAPSDDG